MRSARTVYIYFECHVVSRFFILFFLSSSLLCAILGTQSHQRFYLFFRCMMPIKFNICIVIWPKTEYVIIIANSLKISPTFSIIFYLFTEKKKLLENSQIFSCLVKIVLRLFYQNIIMTWFNENPMNFPNLHCIWYFYILLSKRLNFFFV